MLVVVIVISMLLIGDDLKVCVNKLVINMNVSVKKFY